MPGQILLQMTGDERAVLRALAKVEGQVKILETNMGKAGATMKKSFNQAGEEAERTGKKVKSAFDPKKLISPLISGLVGTGGVIAALRLVGAEFEKIKRLQSEAATAQRTLTQARAELALNLPGKTPADVRGFQQQIGSMALQTGVRESILTSATAEAVSAGAGNRALALSSVRAAARLLPTNPSAIIGLAGALTDLASVTGTEDARINAGLMQFVGGLGRVVKPLQQARNIPAALVSLRALGGTVAGSGALFATLTTLAKDPLGESSRTASIQLARQLRTFLPDVPTTQERIARIQRRPERRAEFFEKASFEARFAAPIEQLLTGGTAAAKLFTTNIAAFPKSNEGFAREFASTRARLAADPLAGTAAMERILGTAADKIRTTRQKAGRAAVVREGLRGVLDATGRGALTGRVEGALFEIETGVGTNAPLAVAIPAIEKRIRTLQGRQFEAMAEAGLAISRPSPTAENLEVVSVLKEMLNELREIKNATTQNGRGPTLVPAGTDFRRLGPNMLAD